MLCLFKSMATLDTAAFNTTLVPDYRQEYTD